MSMRIVAMIITALLVYLGLNAYVGWNGSVLWSELLPGVSPAWFWTVYAVLALSYIGAMALRRLLPYRVFAWLKIIGSYGMAVQFYALLTLPVADLAVWILRWNGISAEASVRIVGGAAAVLLLGLLLYGTRNAWSTVLLRYDLQVDKRAGDGRRELRIAVASDIHLGTVVGNGHLNRLVKKMEELKPDIILLPGDVLDDSLEPFIREHMADAMNRLRQKAPLGAYACLGNHEYIGGHVPDYIRRMKDIGIEVLTDRSVVVDGSFVVAGRKDKAVERIQKEGRLPVRELLADLDHSLPIILLDHQPYGLGDAAEAGVDLMLSGHTHRGQMAPNHLITRRLFELDWGYLRKGAMHAVVSSGYGFWGPPIRLGSRSEVIDIRLTFRTE
ncbi:metallophosphoesterase [Gorillibacterium sp. sgz5001074]|uniref:metallophosphoesterase n=1 Tax=Gorillibacterium sp. sgz5001074 TaxID=3446695 RepID=UPI003F67A827